MFQVYGGSSPQAPCRRLGSCLSQRRAVRPLLIHTLVMTKRRAALSRRYPKVHQSWYRHKMQHLALVCVILAGAWLFFVAGLMWFLPDRCLRWLSLMASTWRINIIELGLRAIAGLAFVGRAEMSKAPAAFEISGWFIVVTSISILLTPRRLHAAYAVWWSGKLPCSFVRLMALPTAIGGALIVYAAI